MNENGIEYTSNVNVQLRVSEVFFPAIAAGLFKVQKKTFTSIKRGAFKTSHINAYRWLTL